MTDADLIVETVWSSEQKNNNHVFFLNRFCISVQARNNTGRTIRIEKVECHFKVEDGMQAPIFSGTCGENIKDNNLSLISVWCDADLALKAHTNNYHIVIFYHDGKKKTFEYDPQKYLIFSPLGPGERHFFISHKDPQDTKRARCLAGFLSKLGFVGYISEDDHRPGMDLWPEKIPQAISDSIGVIILWTSRAAKNPKNIYREITLAKSKRKRLILAQEKGAQGPRAFPKKKFEYHPFERPLSITELKKLACYIHETYRGGGYS